MAPFDGGERRHFRERIRFCERKPTASRPLSKKKFSRSAPAGFAMDGVYATVVRPSKENVDCNTDQPIRGRKRPQDGRIVSPDLRGPEDFDGWRWMDDVSFEGPPLSHTPGGSTLYCYINQIQDLSAKSRLRSV